MNNIAAIEQQVRTAVAAWAKGTFDAIHSTELVSESPVNACRQRTPTIVRRNENLPAGFFIIISL